VWDTKAPVVGDQYVVLGGEAGKPFEGTDLYYKRFLNRYARAEHPKCNITVLNLLKIQEQSEETKLSECYQESLRSMKKELDASFEIVNHDFHYHNRTQGQTAAVESIWKSLGSQLRRDGITCGMIDFAKKPGTGPNMTISTHQTGVIRVNCLDSLDRTTVSSFFMCLQVLAEQCRRLGVGLIASPPSEEPWPCLDCNYKELFQIMAPNLVEAAAEMFVRKGDVLSELYTQTAAMHSSAIRAFAPRLPAATKNLQITVERRMHNMVFDHSTGGRHDQYNMLVGKGLSKGQYFPSLLAQPLKSVSRLPRCSIFSAVPCFFQNWSTVHLLSPGACTPAWVCPGELDIVQVIGIIPFIACASDMTFLHHLSCQVYMYLAEPAMVTEVAITIRTGMSDLVSPAKMEVYSGPALDQTSLALSCSIPRCEV